MDENHEHELGRKLEDRLARFLNRAGFDVIPPGTLGAGMGYSQSDHVEHSYDPESEVLTIIGTTTIRVSRTGKSHENS
jgi:hypothetical protein